MELCDQRLLNIKVPDRISRVPQPIRELKHWKGNYISCAYQISTLLYTAGSELKSWLLYYSLPVLRNVLPLPYFKHFSLLVASIHILTSENISSVDLERCQEWLKAFYAKYTELYGMIIIIAIGIDCIPNVIRRKALYNECTPYKSPY